MLGNYIHSRKKSHKKSHKKSYRKRSHDSSLVRSSKRIEGYVASLNNLNAEIIKGPKNFHKDTYSATIPNVSWASGGAGYIVRRVIINPYAPSGITTAGDGSWILGLLSTTAVEAANWAWYRVKKVTFSWQPLTGINQTNNFTQQYPQYVWTDFNDFNDYGIVQGTASVAESTLLQLASDKKKVAMFENWSHTFYPEVSQYGQAEFPVPVVTDVVTATQFGKAQSICKYDRSRWYRTSYSIAGNYDVDWVGMYLTFPPYTRTDFDMTVSLKVDVSIEYKGRLKQT